ncbi:hypothetical protein BH20CHL6_BH20CHL6_15910 [soil metagenome]
MTDRPSFDHLSAEERAVVGDPEDYAWDVPVEAPPTLLHARSQFSMRIDPVMYAELARIAESRGVSFSDVIREALETFLGRRQPNAGSAAHSIGEVKVIVSKDARGWDGGPTRGGDATIKSETRFTSAVR